MTLVAALRRAALVILTAGAAAAAVAGCGSSSHLQAGGAHAAVRSRSAAEPPATTATVSARVVSAPRVTAPAHALHIGKTERSTHRNAAATVATQQYHSVPTIRSKAATTHVSRPAHRISAAAVTAKPAGSAHTIDTRAISLPRGSSARHTPSIKHSRHPLQPARRSATRHPAGPIQHGRSSHQPNEGTRGNASDLSAINPCTYLKRGVVASALRVASVTAREAPLGPTCVFTARDHVEIATLSVQVMPLSREIRRMRHRSTKRIAGHTSYCGELGEAPTLLMTLSRYYVLAVTAPCSAAKAIAGVALHRIRA
jgi:hypothetical protein